MKFDGDKKRGLGVKVAGVVLGLVLLASCGGSQVEEFWPNRVMAFGDESSAFDDTATPGNGLKYSVNPEPVAPAASGASAVSDCFGLQIWTQIVATNYGLTFQQCHGGPSAGRSWAQPDATVDDVAAQVDAFLQAGGSFTNKDLVMLMAGTNDILDLYRQFPASPQQPLLDAAGAAGTRLGELVIRITNAGARVLITTLPNLSYSPYAFFERGAHPDGRADVCQSDDSNNQPFLCNLTVQFNNKMRVKINEVKNGGRAVGLVLGESLVKGIVLNYPGYGLTDPYSYACPLSPPPSSPAALPPPSSSCFDNNLQSGATSYNKLWSDYARLSPMGHNQLGALAFSRARNNPF